MFFNESVYLPSLYNVITILRCITAIPTIDMIIITLLIIATIIAILTIYEYYYYSCIGLSGEYISSVPAVQAC